MRTLIVPPYSHPNRPDISSNADVLQIPIPAQQKLDYIHNNPIYAMTVAEPEDYIFRSASRYAGGDGLVQIALLV